MIPIKFYRFVFAFIMGGVMSAIMSAVLTYLNLGLVENFISIWFMACLKAFVVAYACVVLIAPIATKITQKICKN